MSLLQKTDQTTIDLPSPFLPHLNDLRLYVDNRHIRDQQLFDAIARSSPSLRKITLSHATHTFPQMFPSLSSTITHLAPSIVHYASEPASGDINTLKGDTARDNQADLLTLLQTMGNLETLTLALHPDPPLFTAIRTLPRLHSLHLMIVSNISPNVLESALTDASFTHLKVTVATKYAWADEDVTAVREAAEGAGISFQYRVWGTLKGIWRSLVSVRFAEDAAVDAWAGQ